MIIKDQRDELDAALQDPESTIMVFSGGPQTAAVHDFVEDPGFILEPWQVCFLIESIAALNEKDDWFGGAVPERYVVLGGESQPKQIAVKGLIRELTHASGKPDKFKIKRAFVKGDDV